MSKLKLKIEYTDSEVVETEFISLYDTLHFLRRLKLCSKLAAMPEFFDRITITPG